MIDMDSLSRDMRVKLAFQSGALASYALVFLAAGGVSVGVELMWPMGGMARFARSRVRAELMVDIEERIPDWLWSSTTVPDE